MAMAPSLKIMNSPELMILIEEIKRQSLETKASKKHFHLIQNILNLLKKIEPVKEYSDLIWSFWFNTSRGKISDWGDFKESKREGWVESYKEFKESWLGEFPEPVQWYNFTVQQIPEEIFFSLDDKYRFSMSIKNKAFSDIDLSSNSAVKFLQWIEHQLEKVISSFLKNSEKFQSDLEKNLPFKYRYGKIKRYDLWKSFPEVKPFYILLGREKLQILKDLVHKPECENHFLKEMTLKTFLEACEVCYLANDYEDFKKNPIQNLSPMAKYKSMADGRQDGLLELPYNDAVAFEQWFNHGSRGGHPWEICRGGNSTHIDFSPYKAKEGWTFYLSGLSYSRCLETVKMAVALYQQNIPFILFKKEAMLRMVEGDDCIGIVPYNCTPKYCHSEFPEEDKIEDFMNLPFEEEDAKAMLSAVAWYPMPTLKKHTKGLD